MSLLRPMRFGLALGSGLALALAFPNYNISLLAWAALCPLLLACVGARPLEGALYGFLHGAVFYPLCLPWIYTVMRRYGGISVADAAGVLALMCAVCAIFPALFGWSVAFVGKSGSGRALLAAPFLWVVFEQARAHLPIFGFPWNLAGYPATQSLALLQLTAWTSIYGLSSLVVACNAVLAWAVRRRTRRAWTAAFACVAFLFAVGTAGSHLVPVAAAPHHVAHLVQTDFPQSESYPADWMLKHTRDINELELLSLEAERRSPGIIVWPEVPAPFSLQDPVFAADAEQIARAADSNFLIGVVDWKRGSNHNWLATNSAVLLDSAGRRVFDYAKIHLVPFGEYVPLRPWLAFAGRLTADISDFMPGKTYSVGTLPGGRFGVFICYEAIFPELVRHFTADGAELLINISNDGWFGRSSAPAQHLMMARVRAVENRRWLLRDTNNGFTVSVDPYGRIVARLRPDQRGVLDAPYDFRSDRSLYVRWGNWWTWLCLVASGGILAEGISKNCRARPGVGEQA